MNEIGQSLALINGEIYPFAPPGRAAAILSRNGVVELLGSDGDVLNRCDLNTVVLDLRGAAVLPGFTDAGAHLFAPADEPESRAALRARLLSMASGGATLAQYDCPGTPGENRVVAMLRELDDAGQLPLRVLPQRVARSLADVEALAEADFLACSGGGFLSPGPLKIILDGSLEDRTAALRQDYSDAPGHRGRLFVAGDELFEMVRAGHRAGRGLSLRAAGDAAVGEALAAFERLAASEPPGERRARHRIVHCAAGSLEQYERIAKLGIAVEIRPHCVGRDWAILLSRLGSERARTAYAWKTLLRRGIDLCAGSGRHSAAPLEGMRAAIERRDAEGRPSKGWMPNEALDRAEAFWLYTRGAADATGMSRERGTLEPGKAADMAVLMKNPFAIPLRGLADIEIGMTVVGGRIQRIV